MNQFILIRKKMAYASFANPITKRNLKSLLKNWKHHSLGRLLGIK